MQARAVVLFGHGSRDPSWSRPIESVAARMRERNPGVSVACAYLEMMDPDLPTAVRALAAAGACRVSVVPMFLGIGKHARHDLPELMAALGLQHPSVVFTLQPAIGEQARIVDLMAEIALA